MKWIIAAATLLVSQLAGAAALGIHAAAKESDAAKALIKFLTASAAAPVIKKHGLEPG